MSSIIKVNTFQDANGNALFSSDGSGTVTLDSNFSGVLPDNTPAFQAKLSANQSMSDDTLTKIQCNDELYDTDNCYDNSTNYRFTPTSAGKYYVYGQFWTNNDTASALDYVNIRIYKNSDLTGYNQLDFRNNDACFGVGVNVFTVLDMNGTSDYAELYARAKISSGTTGIQGQSAQDRTIFGAYKIIGA